MAELSIQEVAKRTGLSAHTLRYYERIGLMAPIKRSESGHRRYSEDDLEWLVLIQRLRATNMSVQEMQRFAAFVREGDATIGERLALLEAHQQKLTVQLDEIKQTLALIEHKVTTYRNLQEGRTSTAEGDV